MKNIDKAPFLQTEASFSYNILKHELPSVGGWQVSVDEEIS